MKNENTFVAEICSHVMLSRQESLFKRENACHKKFLKRKALLKRLLQDVTSSTKILDSVAKNIEKGC